MTARTIDGIDELRSLVGQEVGVSDWLEVTQGMIDSFADVTRDTQWIHADVERARHEAEAAAPARERLVRARHSTPAEGTSTAGVAAAAAALAARFAAAPVAADYEDSGPGRDFAPGLAGKYTTSNADVDAADEDYYDAYEPPRLRAVGD